MDLLRDRSSDLQGKARQDKARYGKTAFSGAGGVESAGRWHRKGQSIVYAVPTLSLAAFELFVHLGRTDPKIKFVFVMPASPSELLA